jgi:hypothetical protein
MDALPHELDIDVAQPSSKANEEVSPDTARSTPQCRCPGRIRRHLGGALRKSSRGRRRSLRRRTMRDQAGAHSQLTRVSSRRGRPRSAVRTTRLKRPGHRREPVPLRPRRSRPMPVANSCRSLLRSPRLSLQRPRARASGDYGRCPAEDALQRAAHECVAVGVAETVGVAERGDGVAI